MDGQELKLIKLEKDSVISTNSNPRIVILLESPNKDEYDKGFKPLRPANGITGLYLCCFLPNHVLPKLIDLGLTLVQKKPFDILLVNHVQYQVSLAWHC